MATDDEKKLGENFGNWKQAINELASNDASMFLSRNENSGGDVSFMDNHLVNLDSSKFKKKYGNLIAYTTEIAKARGRRANTVYGLYRGDIAAFGQDVARTVAKAGPDGVPNTKVYSFGYFEYCTVTRPYTIHDAELGHAPIAYTIRQSTDNKVNYVVNNVNKQAPLSQAYHLVTTSQFRRVRMIHPLLENLQQKQGLQALGSLMTDEKDEKASGALTALTAFPTDRNTLAGAFDTFMTSLMYSPSSSGAKPPKEETILPLWPGIAVAPKVLQNIECPKTDDDYWIAVREFSNLLNGAPSLSNMTQGGLWYNGAKGDIRDQWEYIITRLKSTYEMSDADKAKYEKYEKQIDDLSTKYVEYRTKYNDAVKQYGNNQITYIDEPKKWAIYEKMYKLAEDQAMDDWETMGKKGLYHNAEEQIRVLELQGTVTLINAANDKYKAAEKTVTIHGQKESFRPIEYYPSDAFSKTKGYAKMDINSGQDYSSLEKSKESAGGSTGFSNGLFSFGGKGGWEKTRQEEKEASTNVNISAEFLGCQLSHPYMNGSFLNGKDWYMLGEKAGALSRGFVSANSEDGDLILPAIPYQFIIVRNVTVSADWSESTKTLITEHIKASGGFGIGPFRIGGGYGKDTSSDTKFAEWANGKLTIADPQIIAVKCRTPRLSAPLSDPAHTGK